MASMCDIFGPPAEKDSNTPQSQPTVSNGQRNGGTEQTATPVTVRGKAKGKQPDRMGITDEDVSGQPRPLLKFYGPLRIYGNPVTVDREYGSPPSSPTLNTRKWERLEKERENGELFKRTKEGEPESSSLDEETDEDDMRQIHRRYMRQQKLAQKAQEARRRATQAPAAPVKDAGSALPHEVRSSTALWALPWEEWTEAEKACQMRHYRAALSISSPPPGYVVPAKDYEAHC